MARQKAGSDGRQSAGNSCPIGQRPHPGKNGEQATHHSTPIGSACLSVGDINIHTMADMKYS